MRVQKVAAWTPWDQMRMAPKHIGTTRTAPQPTPSTSPSFVFLFHLALPQKRSTTSRSIHFGSLREISRMAERRGVTAARSYSRHLGPLQKTVRSLSPRRQLWSGIRAVPATASTCAGGAIVCCLQFFSHGSRVATRPRRKSSRSVRLWSRTSHR